MVGETVYVTAKAVRWVSDDPVPGIVEVQVVDGHGKAWSFIDKAPMFEEGNKLTRTTAYPTEIELACTVVGSNSDGIVVSTARPWGIETIDGVSQFTLAPAQVHGRAAM